MLKRIPELMQLGLKNDKSQLSPNWHGLEHFDQCVGSLCRSNSLTSPARTYCLTLRR